MSGYRSVNYYDLCRLCTTSSGTKVNIFSPDGKKKNLSKKIAECLPLVVDEKDRLPKTVCSQCLQQVEAITQFRTNCLNSQLMLESCLNSATLQNGGRVYIKDANGKVTMPAIVTKTQPQAQQQQQGTNKNDFLGTVMQSAGIQNDELVDTKPQVISQFIMDAKHVKTEPSEFILPNLSPSASQNVDKQAKHNALAEFLKMKPNIKLTPIRKKESPAPPSTPIQQQPVVQQQQQQQQHPTFGTISQSQVQSQRKIETSGGAKSKKPKYNLVLTSPTSSVQKAAQPQQTAQLQQTPQKLNIIASPNKSCFLPITLKDGSSDQQIVAHFDAKNLVLPTTYQMQLKFQPQVTTIDGQQVVQLTPTAIPATIQIAPQTLNAQNFQQQQNQTTNSQMLTGGGGIDAATSTTDQEIIFNQLQSNQGITVQQVQTTQQQVQQQQPKYQVTTIPLSSSGAQVSFSTPVTTSPQKQQLGGITVQRISQQAAKEKQVKAPAVQVKLPTKQGLTINRVVGNQQQAVQQQPKPQPQPTSQVQVKKKPPPTTPPSVKKVERQVSVRIPIATSPNSNGEFECTVCTRAFKKKEHLAQHVKLHIGLRPFKCGEDGCNKSFSRKEHLMRHIVSHTGKKMFSCDMCQKFFSRKDNLNKHKRTHTEQGNSNGQFVCDICNKSFVVKMYYVQHKLMHEKKNEQAGTVKSSDCDNEEQQQQQLTTSQISQIKVENSQQQHHQIQFHPQQQNQQQQQPMLQFHISTPVVTTTDMAGNTITLTQASDGSMLKTLGNHDATVLNLANLVNLNTAQFMNSAGEIVGHIKIEK